MNPIQARNLFPITNRSIYLNTVEASPASYRVASAIEAHDVLRGPAENASRALARLFRVPAETIALTGPGEDGMARLAAGMAWEDGDNLVLARCPACDEAPCWRELAGRGVELRRVPRDEHGRIAPAAVIERIDERTRVVALPHVDSWTGVRVDVATIGRECDRRGVVLALDAANSAGVLRLDLSSLPVDFLVATAGRWLTGPETVGVRYARPELLRRLGAAPPSAAVRPTDAVALGAAVELLLEVGPEHVESHALRLADALGEGLRERGYDVLPPWPRAATERSAIVSFRRTGAKAVEVMRDLFAAGVVASAPGDFVRLSTHFFNSDADVARVLDVLAPQGALS